MDFNLITFFNSMTDESLTALAILDYEKLENLCYMLTLDLEIGKQNNKNATD